MADKAPKALWRRAWSWISHADTTLSIGRNWLWPLWKPISSLLGGGLLMVWLWIENLPLWAIVLLGLCAVTLCVALAGFVDRVRRRIRVIRWRRRGRRKQQPSEGNRNSKARLVSDLQLYAGEYANVEISYASVQQEPLTETIRSVFELAGWNINFNNVPLDSYLHKYIPGIQVSGYNTELVQSVAEALREYGLSNVHESVKTHNIKRDNSKYPSAVHRIYITIGHQG